MDKNTPRLAFGGAIALLALALISILAYAVFPFLFGENETAKSLLPVAAMAMIVLSGILAVVGTLLYLHEIVTATNETDWKLLWAAAVVVLGLLGVVAYELVGRKERKG